LVSTFTSASSSSSTTVSRDTSANSRLPCGPCHPSPSAQRASRSFHHSAAGPAVHRTASHDECGEGSTSTVVSPHTAVHPNLSSRSNPWRGLPLVITTFACETAITRPVSTGHGHPPYVSVTSAELSALSAAHSTLNHWMYYYSRRRCSP
jgi:hypothetical protein